MVVRRGIAPVVDPASLPMVEAGADPGGREPRTDVHAVLEAIVTSSRNFLLRGSVSMVTQRVHGGRLGGTTGVRCSGEHAGGDLLLEFGHQVAHLRQTVIELARCPGRAQAAVVGDAGSIRRSCLVRDERDR